MRTKGILHNPLNNHKLFAIKGRFSEGTGGSARIPLTKEEALRQICYTASARGRVCDGIIEEKIANQIMEKSNPSEVLENFKTKISTEPMWKTLENIFQQLG